MSVDESDAVKMVLELEAAPQSFLSDMAAAAQQFAFRFLSQRSRCVYASVALRRYSELFTDLPRLLAALEGQQPSVEALMSIRRRWLGQAGSQTAGAAP